MVDQLARMYDTAAENIEGTYVFHLPSLAFPEMLPQGYHLSYPRARFSPRLTEDQLMENDINMSFSGSMSFSFLRHNLVSTNMSFNLNDQAISHRRSVVLSHRLLTKDALQFLIFYSNFLVWRRPAKTK